MEKMKEIKISFKVAICITIIIVIIFLVAIGGIFYSNFKNKKLENEKINTDINSNIQEILDTNEINTNITEENTNNSNVIKQNEINNNTEKNVSSNNIVNETKDMPIKENTRINKDENQASSVNKRDTAIQEIKNNLKNYEWAKENLYMHRSVFGEKIFGDENQTVLFDVINNADEDAPIIVVQAEVETKNSKQISIVRYKDGEITVKNWDPVHYAHVGYEIKDNLLIESYAHMDSWECNVYKINNNTEEKIESTSGELKNEESDYSELDAIMKKYSSHEINKELNNTNIDKYIK